MAKEATRRMNSFFHIHVNQHSSDSDYLQTFKHIKMMTYEKTITISSDILGESIIIAITNREERADAVRLASLMVYEETLKYCNQNIFEGNQSKKNIYYSKYMTRNKNINSNCFVRTLNYQL